MDLIDPPRPPPGRSSRPPLTPRRPKRPRRVRPAAVPAKMPTLAPHFALASVFNHSRVLRARVMENAGSEAAIARGGVKRREDGALDERRCARDTNDRSCDDSRTLGGLPCFGL